jgi:hypothetical protein
MSTDQPIDRRTARIQVSAEQDRLTRAAEIEQRARQTQLDIERRRQEIQLQKEQRAAKKQERDTKRLERQQARAKLFARIHKLTPTLGRRVMIYGPIIAPMAVAWIGQIGFAHDKLGWPLAGALVFAAAWELTTAFAGWMYHQARKDGDRGTLFRCATWLFACSAGAMNYWHALDGVSIYKPTPKAVSYGAMSLVGIALWELYSSLIHRKHLRAEGIVPSARPRFGIARWARYPRITWTAWSLAVRYGIKKVDEAWSAAVVEIERKDRARDHRSEVRVAVVRAVTRTVVLPKTKVRLFWTDQSATTLSATVDQPAATTMRPPVATTSTGGLPTAATGGLQDANDRSQATNDHPDATTPNDHTGDHYNDRSNDQATTRSRPAQTTTKATGRSRRDKAVADQPKPQPTTEDNKRAVAAYRQSVKDGRPLSQRTLARKFGFSKTWARDRIQEAGPQPVGSGRLPVDHGPVADPKDHSKTSEVKTG